MNIERDIFEMSPDAEAAADQRSLADLAARRGVSHTDLAHWLETWGTPDEGPPPAEWLK